MLHQLIGSNELLWRAELLGSGTIGCGVPSWTWLNLKGPARPLGNSEAEWSDSEVAIGNAPESVASSLGSNLILCVTAYVARMILDASGTYVTDCQVSVTIRSYPEYDSILILN